MSNLLNTCSRALSDQFFILYYRAYYELRYFEKYKERSYYMNKLFTILIAVSSIGGIAAWYHIKAYQIIWAGFVGVMQILQAVLPHFDYAKQITPLTFLIQDRTVICDKMASDWLSMASFSDRKIQKLIDTYSNDLSSSSDRFLSDIVLPEKTSIVYEADKQAKAYFKYTYGIQFEKE